MEARTPRLARRMADIAPFQVMELLRRAHELAALGRDIIHMEVGEPDFPTPQPVIEAGRRFLAGGNVHYTPALGLTCLREAIARFYQDRYKADVAPERIVITPGASGALALVLAMLTDPGDKWLVPDPGYPAYRHITRSFEGVAHPLPVDGATRFQPTPEHVAAAWDGSTRGLIVASPANPTGTLLTQPELKALHGAVSQRGGTLIVDEIYQGLCYGVEPSTVLQSLDDVFVVNSFSKYFGMTGWRLGWLVAPEGCVRDLEKLAQHFFISTSTPAQQAALAAFSPVTLEILEQRRHIFQARRDTLLPALAGLDFRISTEPQGAFYIYADIGDLAPDAHSLAHRLLEEAGVATTPGMDFGNHQTGRHLRVAYTTGEARLLEAAERMARVLKSH